MRFLTRQRRQAPPIIIVSLIDILIVLLIFVMATTTFKQRPALKVSLPESKHAKMGSADSGLIVTVAKEKPYLFLGTKGVTLDQLRQELRAAVIKNPDLVLTLNGDTNASWGTCVVVIDMVNDLHIGHLKIASKLKAAAK